MEAVERAQRAKQLSNAVEEHVQKLGAGSVKNTLSFRQVRSDRDRDRDTGRMCSLARMCSLTRMLPAGEVGQGQDKPCAHKQL
jgi:hypothetical protein